jgi:transposase
MEAAKVLLSPSKVRERLRVYGLHEIFDAPLYVIRTACHADFCLAPSHPGKWPSTILVGSA